MTAKWLPPEQAIVKANLTVTSETLKSYISEQQGKSTAECSLEVFCYGVRIHPSEFRIQNSSRI